MPERPAAPKPALRRPPRFPRHLLGAVADRDHSIVNHQHPAAALGGDRHHPLIVRRVPHCTPPSGMHVCTATSTPIISRKVEKSCSPPSATSVSIPLGQVLPKHCLRLASEAPYRRPRPAGSLAAAGCASSASVISHREDSLLPAPCRWRASAAKVSLPVSVRNSLAFVALQSLTLTQRLTQLRRSPTGKQTPAPAQSQPRTAMPWQGSQVL